MDVTLRPMTADDFTMVSEWLCAPHVDEWWHEPYPPDVVAEKYAPRLDGRGATYMLVVEVDGRPVGFVQWYRWDDYPDDRDRYGAGHGEIGLDYLIGESRACGRGVGSAMIAAVQEHLREAEPGAASLFVGPEVANGASCRILEKNGFERVGVIDVEPTPDDHPEGPIAQYRKALAATRRTVEP